MPYLAFMLVTKGCSENFNEKDDLVLDENNNTINRKGQMNLQINNRSFSFDQFFLVSTNETSSEKTSFAYPVLVRHLRCNYDNKTVLLQNGSKFDSKEIVIDLSFLQSVSHKLCYLYYNSTSIVQQPAPVVVSCF